MTEHPIQGLMKTAMENIKEMVDVNTIVGDPVETPDGSVIMPISKVGFGFAAGGSEFSSEENGSNRNDAANANVSLPFGGGSGGGVSITPIAFLVVSKSGVKIVPLDNQTHLLERLIDSAPTVVDRIQSMMKGTIGNGMNNGAGTSAGTSSVTNNIENQNFIV
ncbi:sporulation protein YtfJ [Paenibacillus sp. LMG 31456]|uniref:Sporulation protein YtfJ n=1 Tax=Paenibacillus foliorum TaxID=2654974 RepID=A0A972GZT6_9BACL|nr:GerW family sporulation protein [Paenibacillus foliorum]NOU97604.1 sporulation protein YtfJ [Paenibacillus foliorum]